MILPYVGKPMSYGRKPRVPRLIYKKADDGSVENIYVKYHDFVSELAEHFSYPTAEIQRIINCVFHKILCTIRDGKALKVPYFGTFSGYERLARISYNVGARMHYDTPTVYMRTHPVYTPDSYSIHVCSPRSAFRPLVGQFMRRNLFNSGYRNSTKYWDLQQLIFRKRQLMLYDNPYILTGIWNGHALPESSSAGIVNYNIEGLRPEDTQLDESVREALQQIHNIQDIQDLKPVEKFIKRVKGGTEYYNKHNYSIETPFGGGSIDVDNASEKGLRAFEIYKKHKCIVERHLAEKTTIREDYRYRCWCNRIQGNFFRKLKRQFELFVQDKLLYKDYRLNARDKVIKLLMLCLIQEYPIIAKIRWSKTLKFYDSEDIDN